MNWDQVQGKWKQLRGAAKKQWRELTDDDLDVINGKRDQLVGKLQERYGLATEDAKKRADAWLKTMREESPDTSRDPHLAGKR